MRAIGAHVTIFVDWIDYENSSYMMMRMDVTFGHCAINYHSLSPKALHQNCIVNLCFQLSPIIVDSRELALRYFSKLRA